ncbi:MAG TPA: hypothetical protein VGX27_12995 [Candidatus Dormibacteraeota bacterium]|nr:hypothetical protein [Candidatus Dormibacteraeota bacterium]
MQRLPLTGDASAEGDVLGLAEAGGVAFDAWFPGEQDTTTIKTPATDNVRHMKS